MLPGLEIAVKEYYNKYYKGIYDEQLSPDKVVQHTLGTEKYAYVIEQLKQLVEISNHRVLEIGCNFGSFSLALLEKIGCKVYGIDIDPRLAAVAQSRISNEGYVERGNIFAGDACQLPFGEDVFDYVVLWMAMEHIQGVERVFDESMRVLRPGGHIYICCPNYLSFWEPHYGIFMFPFMPRFLKKTYVALRGFNSGPLDNINFTSPLLFNRIFRKYSNLSVRNLGYEKWRVLVSGNVDNRPEILQKIVKTARILYMQKILLLIGKMGMYTPLEYLIQKKR